MCCDSEECCASTQLKLVMVLLYFILSFGRGASILDSVSVLAQNTDLHDSASLVSQIKGTLCLVIEVADVIYVLGKAHK